MEITSKQRLAFIDVLRGIACVWMVQTHVLNTCLAQEFRSGLLWNWLNISNGFVAVCFVFCAGAGFSIFTDKYSKEITSFTPTLFSYLKRLGFILFIGFVLQLPPEMSWSRLLSMNEIEWQKFYEFDVLHCIVLSSVIALGILWVLRISKKYQIVLFCLLAFVAYAIPYFLWNSGALKSIPYEIATIFERPPLSAFPIFPWIGHFFLGVAITSLFSLVENKRATMVKLIVISSITIVLMILTKNLLYTSSFDVKEWWDTAFSHFVYRGSVVVLLFALLYFLEQRLQISKIAKFFQILGKESLVIYALHLFLLYTTYKKMGIKEWYFLNATPLEVATLTVVLTGICFVATIIWSKSKKEFAQGSKIVLYGFWFWFFVFFFFGKQLGLVVQP
jgi:uncharacterized membrane protein